MILFCSEVSRDSNSAKSGKFEAVFTYEGTNDIHLLILGNEITGIPAF